VRAGYVIIKAGIATAASPRVRLLIATSIASHSLNAAAPPKVLLFRGMAAFNSVIIGGRVRSDSPRSIIWN